MKNKEVDDDNVADNVRQKLKKPRIEEKNDDQGGDDENDERSERRYVLLW